MMLNSMRLAFQRRPICLVGIPFLAVCLSLNDIGLAADLRVMTTGLGNGTVTSAPAGINCGADCDESYTTSLTVTLTAVPAPGSGAGLAAPR